MKDDRKLIVVALGGNAIKRPDEKGTAEDQFRNISLACDQLVKMNKADYKLVLTHGNGPQAGNLLIQQEESAALVPALPLDVCDAMTQGELGYIFQNQLRNAFRRDKRTIPVATIITQVLVDKDDPDFENPSKPVGPFYTKEEAIHLKQTKNYNVKEVRTDIEKCWRRVVPSPEPIGLIENESIGALLDNHVIVITSGGGGIPVIEKDNGQLKGIEAVVDKDKAGQKLAEVVKADIFLVLSDVDAAFLNFGKPEEKRLKEISLTEAKKYDAEGHFSAGSMGPKIQACIRFVAAGGEKAIITSLDKAVEALEGKAGTRIVP